MDNAMSDMYQTGFVSEEAAAAKKVTFTMNGLQRWHC